MPARTSKGGGIGEEEGGGGPTSIREGNECQRERWIPKRGVDCEIPHRLRRRTKHHL